MQIKPKRLSPKKGKIKKNKFPLYSGDLAPIVLKSRTTTLTAADHAKADRIYTHLQKQSDLTQSERGIANRFYDEIKKSKPNPPTHATTTPTVKTIMDQIDWRDLNLAKFKFIKIDENTLRVHKGKKKLDIKYNEGTDLYDIKKHTIKKNLDVKTEEIDGIYNDQLKDIISRFFKHSYINLR